MNKLVELINAAGSSSVGKVQLLRADLERISLSATLRKCALTIIPSSDGEIATVYEAGDSADYSHQTGYFDLHKDGLYHPNPPDFLLLYCEDAGRGDNPTVVVDTRPVVEAIRRRPELQILEEIELVYQDKFGKEYARPLLSQHPLGDWGVLNLGSRAYLRPIRSIDARRQPPTLRQLATAMTEVFRLLDAALMLRHYWSRGDLLLIDNHTFVHGREAKNLDFHRKLLRVWLSIRDGGRQ